MTNSEIKEYDLLQSFLVKKYPRLAFEINSHYQIMKNCLLAGEFVGHLWPEYKKAVYKGFGISF